MSKRRKSEREQALRDGLPAPPSWATDWEIGVWRHAHRAWKRCKPGGVWLCKVPPDVSAWGYERLLVCGMDPGFGYVCTMALGAVNPDIHPESRAWVDKIEDGKHWKALGAHGWLVFVKPGPDGPSTYADVALVIAQGAGIPTDSLSPDLMGLMAQFDWLAAKVNRRRGSHATVDPSRRN
jgi:hypothetical protein